VVLTFDSPVPGYERTRAYRDAHPDAREREKRRNAARQRALVALARAYPDEFSTPVPRGAGGIGTRHGVASPRMSADSPHYDNHRGW
jgi:hypothetical protein